MRTDKATKKAVQEQMKLHQKLPRKPKKILKKALTKMMIDLLPISDKIIFLYPCVGYAGNIMGARPITFQ